MSSQKLFELLSQRAVDQVKTGLFKKALIVSADDFAEFRQFFVHSGGFLRSTGLRTKEYFRHLHANVAKNLDIVEIHIDHGNVAKNRLLVLFHFFLDVIPLIGYSLARHRHWFMPALRAYQRTYAEIRLPLKK